MKKIGFCPASIFPLIFLIPVSLCLSYAAHAAEVTWTAGSGSINNAANWNSFPALPGVSDDVIFANSSTPSLSATGDLTNASAYFGGGVNTGYDINLGAGNTWTLTDHLDVSLESEKSWTFYSGTVTVRNEEGTATATFGTKSPDTYGRLYMRGGTLNVDHLHIAGFDGANPGLNFEEGTLNVYKGSTISVAASGAGGSINFGSVAGKTATANFLGGSHTASGEALFVGGAGKGLVSVDGSDTTFTFSGVSFVIGRNNNSVDNKFTVSGGAEVSLNLTSSIIIGYETSAAANTLEVTGAGSRFVLSTGNITLGKNNSTGNEIIVSDGGYFKLGEASKPIYIGEGTDASGNKLTVTGQGSLLETAASGDNSYIGVGMNGHDNQLLITEGGRVNAYRVYAGVSANAKKNSIIVDKGGLLHIIDSIGAQKDATNTIHIRDGGILEFEKKTPNIGASDGATVTLGDGGILSFAGVVDAPTAAVSNLIYSGVNNGLRLDHSQNATVESYTFTSGTVGTYARLELKNDGVWTSETLEIGEGGVLAGSGTVDAEMTWVYSGGTLSIGNSPGTMSFLGNLILEGTSEFEIHGFGAGEYDLAWGGTSGGMHEVVFGGTLHLTFQSGFDTVGSVTLFDFANYNEDFSTVNVTGLAAGYSAEFNAQTGIVTVIPEPKVWILLGMGLSFIFFRTFRNPRRVL